VESKVIHLFEVRFILRAIVMRNESWPNLTRGVVLMTVTGAWSSGLSRLVRARGKPYALIGGSSVRWSIS
jgi:hypothetical protein